MVSSLIKDGDVFFFAGSGISLQSNLPSVKEVLEKTMSVFLPDTLSEEEKRILLTIQPKVFYETLSGDTNYNQLKVL
jgi:hypothetical protein